jgi:hypothetical protein
VIVEDASSLKEINSSLFLPAVILSFLGFFLSCTILEASDKPVIGADEYVFILPYKIKVPARVDTGAATTSLDARNLSVAGDTVTFTLPSRPEGSAITVPIVAWRYIRSSGSRERRPVVEMELCIASKRLRARVNLNDRSNMKYPMIIGRNVTTGNFLVDTSKSFTTPPLGDDEENGE